MQSIFNLEIIVREKHRDLIKTAEINRQINKLIRKKRARKILSKAVERGLRNGLTVDELISELGMVLDSNGYAKQAKHINKKVVDHECWHWKGAYSCDM